MQKIETKIILPTFQLPLLSWEFEYIWLRIEAINNPKQIPNDNNKKCFILLNLEKLSS